MSDNDSLRPEDFEPHRVESDVGTQRATFSTVLRQQPLLRLVVLVLPVVVVVVLIMTVFGNSKKAPLVSKVDSGSTVKDLTNSGAANENYRKAVEEADKAKVQKAQETGGSVIVTGPPPVTQANQAIADPLAPFTTTPVVAAPPVRTPVQAPPVVAPAQPQQQAAKIDPALSQSYRQEMQAIIDGLKGSKVAITHVTSEQQLAAANAAAGNGQGQFQAASATTQVQPPVLIAAGTVIYGQTLTEADSDIPAPILVSVLSGPLQGGRAIGTFQKADEYLILAFGTIIKDKKEYKVNAIAMDPETTLTGLQTDVDHHYFERFVLPAAAGFVSGIGNYTQQAGSTVTQSTYGVTQSYPPLNTHQIILSGLGQSANAVASAVNQESNVPITIHVASGTPIGIMFVNSVHEGGQ